MSEAKRTIANQCAGTRRDGQPCGAPVTGETGWCFTHDPERAERDEARRRGGENRADAVRLRSLVPPRLLSTYDVLEKALGDVHRGELDARKANAMASIARAMVAVLTAGELEERVRALEGKASQ